MVDTYSDRSSRESPYEIKARHRAEIEEGRKIVVNVIVFMTALSGFAVWVATMRGDRQALGTAFIQFVLGIVYCATLYRGQRWSYIWNVGWLIFGIPFGLWVSYLALTRGHGMLSLLMLSLVFSYFLCAYVLLCVPSVHRFLKHQQRYYSDYRRRLG